MLSKKVAIVGSGQEWSGLPVFRELGKLNYKIFGLLQKPDSTSTHTKYLNKVYKIRKDYDDLLFKQIMVICKSKKIDYLICLDEEIKYLLVKNRKKIGNIKCILPSLNSYKTSFKKNLSSAFVNKLGIPVPSTIIIHNRKELEKLEFDFSTPAVIKGIRGWSSLHVRYASTHEELLKYYDEIYSTEKSIKSVDGLPIIQKYFGGPTYLTQGFAQNGKVKAIVPHVKFREWPLTGGYTTRAKTIEEPKLVEYTTKILEELNWHGEAGMEWKYDPISDDFVFLEMNPRFEGSLDIAIKSGINFPKMLIDAMENRLVINSSPKPNTNYRWFFRQDFSLFLYKPYGFFTLISESLNPNIHGELSWNDLSLLRVYWKKPFKDLVNWMRNR